jgi:ribosomal protein S18 acetylase RimI-like enzyme
MTRHPPGTPPMMSASNRSDAERGTSTGLVGRPPRYDRHVDDPRLIALVDENLAAFVRHFGGSTPHAIPGSILWSAGATSGAPGRGYSVWTRAHADAALEAILPAGGFSRVVDLPVMVLETRPEARPVPDWTQIRAVVDEAGVGDFRTVDRAAFAAEEGGVAIDSVFCDPESLLHPDVAVIVAYVDAVPVATAMSFTALGVTRVAWVGTVPAFRRRSLGDAVTRAAVLAGFDRGATIAALESSPAGLDLYRSMGFRQVTTYRIWRIE